MRDLRPPTGRRLPRLLASASLALVTAGPLTAQSTDLYLEGTGARALAIGGAVTARPGSPLAALAYNPAGIAGVRGWTVVGSLTGVRVNGEYSNRVSTGNGMGRQSGAIGSIGVSWVTEDVAVGFAAQPVNAYLVDWEYPDVPGVEGARYDGVDQRAFFLNYRVGLGVSWRLSDRLVAGVGGGLVYNRNELDAPYVFQNQPVLAGLKVDVDLVADTWAPSFNLGLLYEVLDAMTLGLSYTSNTSFRAEGRLEGSAAAQFSALGLTDAPTELRYDAEVETGLPRMVSLGAAVDATDRLALFVQADWVDWNGEFGSLPLQLENGANLAVNSLVGGDALQDESPLGWESRVVTRLGLTYEVDEPLTGRLGYSHADSPVPDSTFTPLSGLITEHTISAGLGWQGDSWRGDVAYQFELPAERTVGTSALLSGEYSDTRTNVSIHRLTFSIAASL